MTSLYSLRTVSTPRVMPPKIATIPRPIMSMEEDAKLCNRRQNGGHHLGQSVQSNINRINAARERYERIAHIVLDTLRRQPMSRAEIVQEFGLSKDVFRRVIQHMLARDMIVSTGNGAKLKWGAAK